MPRYGFEPRDFLDEAVVVGGDQRHVQCGQQLNYLRILGLNLFEQVLKPLGKIAESIFQ